MVSTLSNIMGFFLSLVFIFILTMTALLSSFGFHLGVYFGLSFIKRFVLLSDDVSRLVVGGCLSCLHLLYREALLLPGETTIRMAFILWVFLHLWWFLPVAKIINCSRGYLYTELCGFWLIFCIYVADKIVWIRFKKVLFYSRRRRASYCLVYCFESFCSHYDSHGPGFSWLHERGFFCGFVVCTNGRSFKNNILSLKEFFGAGCSGNIAGDGPTGRRVVKPPANKHRGASHNVVDNVNFSGICSNISLAKEIATMLVNIQDIPGSDHLLTFTDGSCLNNGCKNAMGGYGCVWPGVERADAAYAMSPSLHDCITNNRAELLAIILAFEIASLEDIMFNKCLYLVSDSLYAVEGLRGNFKAWKASNFKTRKGVDIGNGDLINRILEISDKRTFKILHIKSHLSKQHKCNLTDWNDKVDVLASGAASGDPTEYCCPGGAKGNLDPFIFPSGNEGGGQPPLTCGCGCGKTGGVAQMHRCFFCDDPILRSCVLRINNQDSTGSAACKSCHERETGSKKPFPDVVVIASGLETKQNDGKGNCAFLSLLQGYGAVNKQSSHDLASLRAGVCGWAMNNQLVAFEHGHTLWDCTLFGKPKDSPLDDKGFYSEFWASHLKDFAWTDSVVFFAAAGFLNVDIHLWETTRYKNIELKESYRYINSSSKVRPQVHLWCTGNLAESSGSGHYEWVFRYNYLLNKSSCTMDSFKSVYDLRLQDSLDMVQGTRSNKGVNNIFSPSVSASDNNQRRGKGVIIDISLDSVPCNLNPSCVPVKECYHRFKGVSGIPFSVKVLFQRVLLLILVSLNKEILIGDKSKEKSKNSVAIDNIVAGFLFLPSLCVNSHGKTRHVTAIRNSLELIINAADPVERLLEARAAFMLDGSSRKPNEGKDGRKPLSDKNCLLGSSTKKRISEFIKVGRPGKGLSTLYQAYHAHAPPSVDASGKILKDIQDKFDKLHPLGIDLKDSNFSSNGLVISKEVLREVIDHLPLKSANGLSSWTNDLLKFVTRPDHDLDGEVLPVDLSEDIIDNLLSVINMITKGSGGSPKAWINSFFFFIGKGGGDVRPIAVDDIFIRVIGKCIARMRGNDIGEMLSSVQFGVGFKGGCEFIVHSVSNWVSEILASGSSSKVIIKIDLANAFNTISREAIQAGINKHCPELLPYFNWAYGSATNLVLVNGIIIGRSSSGVRQGDPLGPLFFSLGFMEALSTTKSNFPEVDILAYLDDCFFHGEKTVTLEALKFFQTALLVTNLKIKFAKNKTSIFGNASLGVEGLEELYVAEGGFLVLGCPVGSEAYVAGSLKTIFDDYENYIFLLKHVDPQIGFILLKMCVNTKPSYISRVCPPWLLEFQARRFDLSIDQTLSSWLKVDCLTNVASIVRGIPSGLGIPRLLDISKPAWVSSFVWALSRGKSTYGVVWDWVFRTGNDLLPKHVTCISSFVDNFCFNEFDGSVVSQESLSLIQETSNINSVITLLGTFPAKLSYFMSALKNKTSWTTWPMFSGNNPGIIFDYGYFNISLKLRLLMSILPDHLLEKKCGCKLTTSGDIITGDVDNELHCFDCALVAANRIGRHDFLCNEILVLVNRYIPKASVESEFLIKYQNKEDKKADLKIILPDGKIFFVDVTIFNPGAKSYQKMDPVSLMRAREKNKLDQYKKVGFDINDKSLIPFVFDVTGNIGPKGLDFVEVLHAYAKFKCPKFREILNRRLNVALAQGLAKTVMSFIKAVDSDSVFDGGSGGGGGGSRKVSNADLPVPLVSIDSE